jgi:hypothetical protein
MGYECSVIDKRRDNWGSALETLGRFPTEGLDAISGITPRHSDALAEVSAVAQSPVRNTGEQRFRLTEREQRLAHAQAGGLASSIDIDIGDSTAEGDDVSGATGDVDVSDSTTDGDDVGGAATDDEEATPENTSETVVRGGTDPDVGGLATSISMDEPSYVVADARTMTRAAIPTADGEMSKAGAQRALSAFRAEHPQAGAQLQVVEAHKATAGTGGASGVATDGGDDR